MGVLSGDLVGVLFCQQFQFLHQAGIVGVDPVSYTHLLIWLTAVPSAPIVAGVLKSKIAMKS